VSFQLLMRKYAELDNQTVKEEKAKQSVKYNQKMKLYKDDQANLIEGYMIKKKPFGFPEGLWHIYVGMPLSQF